MTGVISTDPGLSQVLKLILICPLDLQVVFALLSSLDILNFWHLLLLVRRLVVTILATAG